jgi:hypothetical protein
MDHYGVLPRRITGAKPKPIADFGTRRIVFRGGCFRNARPSSADDLHLVPA